MASGLTESGDLVVEDGTGKDDANSYVSIADALAYANLRQTIYLQRFIDADESNQVAALIIGTQYVDARWRYLGELLEEDQALAFPRNSGPIYDSEGIDVSGTVPWQIVDSTIEYAARAIDEDLQATSLRPDLEVVDDAGRFIKAKREKLGPLEEETRYSEARATRTRRTYPIPDDIIRRSGLLSATGERAIRA